ncbi:hypothetical protein JXA40_07975 [bacterium]|nr:hypothetical protein [candidate division CSSED10-310 bacterium]
MNRIIQLSLLALTIALAGCTAVVSENMIGMQPVPVNPGDWDGLWYDGEGYLHLKVKDAANGVIRVTLMDPEENDRNDEINRRSFDMVLRKGQSMVFGNMLMKEAADPELISKDNENTYLWFLLETRKNQATAFCPDTKPFKTLTGEGKLNGKILEDGVILTGSSGEVTSRIEALAGEHMLFEWRTPFTFTRLTCN